MYDVNYFIKKFEAIPEEKWTVLTQYDGVDKYCAVGHCNLSNDIRSHYDYVLNGFLWRTSENSEEVFYLQEIIFDAGLGRHCVPNGWDVADINNGHHPKYQQSTPKKRILAALADAKHIEDKKILVQVDSIIESIKPIIEQENLELCTQ